MRIALCGEAGVGKSTIATIAGDTDLLCSAAPPHTSVSIADPLYASAASALSVSELVFREMKRGVHGPSIARKARVTLQRIGDVMRETWGPDVLLASLVESFKRGQNIVVDDLRLPYEAVFLRKHGFVIVRVVGPAKNAPVDNHVTESSIDDIVCDYQVLNDRSRPAYAVWAEIYRRLQSD